MAQNSCTVITSDSRPTNLPTLDTPLVYVEEGQRGKVMTATKAEPNIEAGANQGQAVAGRVESG